ncbi:MAG: DUF3159 domain-containing protein [Rothia sp. (in: high G+C Gram-positive bacteria)]|uniref:DUF3159 domain-containing protein n=1 Tax=Rothia sp. (in: high G+C Gram-positive bacteria) TaxID=1885016 RepID=UPI0026DF5FC5|nr:DUF3159 domain-containing protein [Rothia sp. (in: high G+C Gram-positive bacteria)]MDO5750819.1 DUF3159 domain-containing protein [Rothia sp. (in: high G+C Gram-positive bacteria)]
MDDKRPDMSEQTETTMSPEDSAEAAETAESSEIQAPSLSESLAASMGANMRYTASGQVDVLHAMGGVRGMAESVLPSLAFLVIFTFLKDMNLGLIISLGLAAVFSIARLLQRSKLIPALSGLIGVGICAFAAYRTGSAENYYLPGFWTNAAYAAVLILSILARYPLMGFVFGFIRTETSSWRKDPLRLRAYTVATWIVTGMFVVRLAVQLPLYFAGATEALGATRLLMGLPLYALTLWLAWRVSASVPSSEAE